jgi:hypothetical protein
LTNNKNNQIIYNKKKGKEKWINELPNDCWFYILNEFICEKCKTNQLLNLSFTCSTLYKQLLSNELIMNNFTFTLRQDLTLKDLIENYKPNYQIRNLSLACHSELTIEQLKHLKNKNYFNLHELDLSFCHQITNEFINKIPITTIKVLHLIYCNKNLKKELILKGLKELKQLKI